jgi:(R,R)-butanediol dehydrogenase/meso-butanediol dehydrogenase/diacetyl reductase
MKALLFDVNIPKFLMIQALRPLSSKFCYSGPFKTVQLVNIAEPELPSPEWVKIKTGLCGFCGSDINLILLKDSPTASPFTSFPCVPGHEIFGEIVEIGSDVKVFHIGDRVTLAPMLSCTVRGVKPECRSCREGRPGNCENFAEGAFSAGMFTGICRDINGGFAEYVVGHQSQLYRVPENISPESAVLTEPLAVAVQVVLDSKPEKHEKVLLIGGGVIGSLLIKAIRALDIGCDITVAEPSPFQAEHAMESGADRVIREKIIDTAEDITAGRAYKPMLGQKILMGGFDKVYDTVGHTPTLNRALRVTNTGGTISVIGIGKDVKLDLTPLWLKLQTVKGCYSGTRQAFHMALQMMEEGAIGLEDMVTHKFPLEEYSKMIEANINKTAARAIKTVVYFEQ